VILTSVYLPVPAPNYTHEQRGWCKDICCGESRSQPPGTQQGLPETQSLLNGRCYKCAEDATAADGKDEAKRLGEAPSYTDYVNWLTTLQFGSYVLLERRL